MCTDLKAFLEKLINTHIFLKEDFISVLIEKFDIPIQKLAYPNNNLDSSATSLDFYKNFNSDYYSIIMEGINKKDIIIASESEMEAHTDTKTGKTTIKLERNDGDIIMITHELAHYIDRALNPHIIPDQYWFLGETFVFYMERELEKFLGLKYKYLFDIRKNNRLYMEKNMLQMVKLALYYKNKYLKDGKLELTKKDSKNVKRLMHMKEDNLINLYLSYPVANITSLYLINCCKNITKENFCERCFSCDIENFFKDNQHLIGINKKTNEVSILPTEKES